MLVTCAFTALLPLFNCCQSHCSLLASGDGWRWGWLRTGAALHHTHPHSLTPFPMMICRAELKFAPLSLGLWSVSWGQPGNNQVSAERWCGNVASQYKQKPSMLEEEAGEFPLPCGGKMLPFLENLLFMEQTHSRSWVLCWASTRDIWEMEPGEPHGLDHTCNIEQEALPVATLCVPSSAVLPERLLPPSTEASPCAVPQSAWSCCHRGPWRTP